MNTKRNMGNNDVFTKFFLRHRSWIQVRRLKAGSFSSIFDVNCCTISCNISFQKVNFLSRLLEYPWKLFFGFIDLCFFFLIFGFFECKIAFEKKLGLNLWQTVKSLRNTGWAHPNYRERLATSTSVRKEDAERNILRSPAERLTPFAPVNTSLIRFSETLLKLVWVCLITSMCVARGSGMFITWVEKLRSRFFMMSL